MPGLRVESPDSMRQRNTQQNNLTGIAKAIQEFANIKANKTKLQGEMAANTLKAQNNFFYKMQEQKMANDSTAKMMEGYNKQDMSWLDSEEDLGVAPYSGPNDGSVMPGTKPQKSISEVFDLPITPELRVGQGGKSMPYYPKAKEFWLKKIQQKERRFAETRDQRFALTPREQAFKKQIVEGRNEDEFSLLDPKVATDLGSSSQYSSEQEQTIKDNMEAYGKSREEIIQALTDRNLL